MVGEQVQEMQQAGWISTTPIDVAFPAWLGTWFATFPNVEGVTAEAAAAVVVLGSYFLAGELRFRRPRRRGEAPAVIASAPESDVERDKRRYHPSPNRA